MLQEQTAKLQLTVNTLIDTARGPRRRSARGSTDQANRRPKGFADQGVSIGQLADSQRTLRSKIDETQVRLGTLEAEQQTIRQQIAALHENARPGPRASDPAARRHAGGDRRHRRDGGRPGRAPAAAGTACRSDACATRPFRTSSAATSNWRFRGFEGYPAQRAATGRRPPPDWAAPVAPGKEQGTGAPLRPHPPQQGTDPRTRVLQQPRPALRCSSSRTTPRNGIPTAPPSTPPRKTSPWCHPAATTRQNKTTLHH